MTSFSIFPRYDELYDGPVPELNDVIKDIPTCFIVGFACQINAWKHCNQFDVMVDLKMFHLLTERLGAQRSMELKKKLEKIYIEVKTQGNELTIFPLPNMLRLIEYSIANYKEGPFEQIPLEHEENLLKAVLILNRTEDIKSTTLGLSKDPKDSLTNFIRISWPFMLPMVEHTTRKEIAIPMYQSILLLDFLYKDKDFKPYMEKYLSNNGLHNVSDYIKGLVGLYLMSYNKDKNEFYSNFNEEDLKNTPILLNYVREVDSTAQPKFQEGISYFKLLREKPILKINDGKCFISNWSFILDKLYEGLKYDFFEYSGIQDILKGDKWNSFLKLLGEKFSEKIILKELTEKYLALDGVVYKFEDKAKGLNQDLYHRKDNHISFIEYKSVKLALKDNFPDIMADVECKMVKTLKNGKAKKKAVYQLIAQIQSFHDNINKFENLESLGYKRERLFIYPIIMFTEYNWRIPGINDYLNKIFQEEILKLNLKFFCVSELVMMHTDFFYFHEEVFLKDKTNLHQVVYKGLQVKNTFREAARKYRFPPTQSIVNSYSDFDFCAGLAYLGKVSLSNNMTLLGEVIAKLDLPK